MALQVTVPISTAVIEANPDCAISGVYENGRLLITIDTRAQHVHQRLGLSTKTQLHWGKEHDFEVPELSALAWPIRYRILTRDGSYLQAGQRVHFTTAAQGLDARRGVSAVLMRAAVLLVVVAGVGCRRAAWLLAQLFHVQVSKSARQRWIAEIAAPLPAAAGMLKALHQHQPITEAHFAELFPRGSDTCVLVLKDEHGRLLATEAVDTRDEQTVVPFLKWLKTQGITPTAFYIDGCQAYYNAIRTVFGEAVAIQYDSFHILQNVWRHLRKWATHRRRQFKARSHEVRTPWYKKKLEALATRLWKNRYLLFKAEAPMTPEEQQTVAELGDAEEQVGKLRAFLGGVWHIFEDSQDEQEARTALAALKQLPVDPTHPEPFQKVVSFLNDHFAWMTAYLRHEGVKRNSLAESGMRVLRRLEVEHDGFRSATGRSNCLRIYQAVKYLGWTVQRPFLLEPKPT
jgi:hypothetical protein